jgi:hypothetical protein
MRTQRTTLLVAALFAAAPVIAEASVLTRPQIVKAVTDLEMCIRTMCIPAGNATMSLQWAQDLRAKLAQNSNALDTWTIGRLDPAIGLLKQKQLPGALASVQATLAALIRPDFLKKLTDLEVCVRTMCLPAGEASMGTGYAKQIVADVSKFPGAFSQFVTQRLNAAVLLLQQKKIREGLAHIQGTIKDLPNP